MAYGTGMDPATAGRCKRIQSERSAEVNGEKPK